MSNATAARRKFKRYLAYPLQALAIYALFYVFRLLPLDTASALGSWAGQKLGPLFFGTRKLTHNLALGLPELTGKQRADIARDVWENLGRVMAEYPHLDKMDGERVEVVGRDVLVTLHEAQQPFILVSGHFANWEVMPVTAVRQGLDLQLVYRHANNPYVDSLLRRARRPAGTRLARKGVEGARSVHGMLRSGGAVGMLIDQKHTRGLPIPFFGRPAMTAPSAAELALRYQAPLVLARIERLEGARFRLTILPPLEMPPPDTPANVAVTDIMTRLNAQMESWIRERPGQWLWLHRRWGG